MRISNIIINKIIINGKKHQMKNKIFYFIYTKTIKVCHKIYNIL